MPPSGLKPHTDILREFPYLDTPHQERSCLDRATKSHFDPQRTFISELRLRKLPGAVGDFGARTKEPHHGVPAQHGQEAVRNPAVAAPNSGDAVAILRRINPQAKNRRAGRHKP
jgi:hypothetical protein